MGHGAGQGIRQLEIGVLLGITLSLFAPGALGAAPAHRRPARSNEPFESFRLLDRRLTQLDQELRQATQVAVQSKHSRAWVKPARRARASALAVRSIGRRLRLRYGGTRRRFADRLFRPLEHSAAMTAADIRRALAAKTRARAVARLRAASSERLALVLHYQAVSGGYAALRCGGGEWACCEPKRLEDPVPGVKAACNWGCARNRSACRAGVLGPRSAEPVPSGALP